MLGPRWYQVAASAALLAFTSQQTGAVQLVVDGVPLAKRTVIVSSAQLSDSEAIAAVKRELRTAAKAVCKQEYPGEGVYLFSHACYAGSLGDALDQLQQLRTSLAARQSGGAQQLAIAVTAR